MHGIKQFVFLVKEQVIGIKIGDRIKRKTRSEENRKLVDKKGERFGQRGDYLENERERER